MAGITRPYIIKNYTLPLLADIILNLQSQICNLKSLITHYSGS